MRTAPPVLVGSVRNVFDMNTEGGYFWERYEIEYHGSALSHLDALCHVAYNGKVYNGRSFEDVASTEDGCTKLGIVNLQDGLVTRGVLSDMPGKAVRRQDIEAWEAETGITISAGDALFLRTGRDVGQMGGYHPSLIPFLKERDIALLGGDVPQDGVTVEHLFIDDHFSPEIGFVRRDDIRKSYGLFRFSLRPRPIAAIRKFTWEGSYNYITDASGFVETREPQGRFGSSSRTAICSISRTPEPTIF